MREKAAPAAADGPRAIVPAPRLALTEATRRWTALLQRLVEVDPPADALTVPCGRPPRPRRDFQRARPSRRRVRMVPPGSASHLDRCAHGAHGARARRRARHRPSRGAGERRGPEPRVSPPRLKFLSRSAKQLRAWGLRMGHRMGSESLRAWGPRMGSESLKTVCRDHAMRRCIALP